MGKIKLEDYKYITYLIGAMEAPAEGDDGSSKRETLEKELKSRLVYPINPVQLEKYKINISTDKAKQQMNQLIKENKVSEFKDFSRLIWKGKYLIDKKYGLIHIPGDFDYVKMSDWVTFAYNKNDKCCGSFGEAFKSFDRETPVYMITDYTEEEIVKNMKKSLLQCIHGSGGYIFRSIGDYLNFIENKYGVSIEQGRK